jgi:hypothetical protein
MDQQAGAERLNLERKPALPAKATFIYKLRKLSHLLVLGAIFALVMPDETDLSKSFAVCFPPKPQWKEVHGELLQQITRYEYPPIQGFG